MGTVQGRSRKIFQKNLGRAVMLREARRHRSKGKSYSEIAELMDISESSVRFLLKEEG